MPHQEREVDPAWLRTSPLKWAFPVEREGCLPKDRLVLRLNERDDLIGACLLVRWAKVEGKTCPALRKAEEVSNPTDLDSLPFEVSQVVPDRGWTCCPDYAADSTNLQIRSHWWGNYRPVVEVDWRSGPWIFGKMRKSER